MTKSSFLHWYGVSEQYIVSQIRMHQEEVGECLSKMIESLSHSLKHAHKTLQPKTADGELFTLIIGTWYVFTSKCGLNEQNKSTSGRVLA